MCSDVLKENRAEDNGRNSDGKILVEEKKDSDEDDGTIMAQNDDENSVYMVQDNGLIYNVEEEL